MSANAQLPSARAQAITRRTYNRPHRPTDPNTTFETWLESIRRVISHQRWLWERAQGGPLTEKQEAELEELRLLMMRRSSLPAGRTLWLGGTELVKRREASMFNCSFLEVRTVHDMVDAFWLLLQGCGVGFKPVSGALSGFVRKMDVQVVRSEKKLGDPRGEKENVESFDPVTKIWSIRIGDSAEAWAKSIGKLVVGKFPARKIVLDFSEIRAAGEPLAGYGWMCSGDEAISQSFEAICQILNAHAGKLLSKNALWDILNWLGTTLSSRRSAQIGLVDYGDDEWATIASRKYKGFDKTADWYRGQSNNSVVFHEKPTKRQLSDLFDLIIANGGSEPGFINARAALKRAPWFRGLNPCLAGDTLIPVKARGLVRIRDLCDKTAGVMDGSGKWQDAVCRKTGVDQELIAVELSDGSVYKVTPTHRFKRHGRDEFVTAEQLLDEGVRTQTALMCPNSDAYGDAVFGERGDPHKAYLDAWLRADGTWHNDHGSSKLQLYEPKYKYAPSLSAAGAEFGDADANDRMTAYFAGYPCPAKDHVPDYVLGGNKETVLAYIRGTLESDGHVGRTEKGLIVQVVCVHRTFLEEFQALLRLLNVYSKIALSREEGDRPLPDGKGGHKDYHCPATWRLSVSNPAALLKFTQPELVKRGPYQKSRAVGVVRAERLTERGDVYCFGVPSTGSFDLPTVHSGNCAEILLPSYGFCNLVETDLFKFKNISQAELHRALYLIARCNYRQTCVNLRDGILQSAWHETNEYLRLCGVGLTGIVRRPDLTAWDYRQMKYAAVHGAYGMADELDLERPKNVTTVKPSGTLSKIMDTTEGCHRPLGRYIFNNVSFNRMSPVVPRLLEAGYRLFDHPTDRKSVLAVFPEAYPDVAFDKAGDHWLNRESAVSQLERYRTLMREYVDQNVSITVSYDPDEKKSIVDWLDRNWDENLVAVSFLYRADPFKTAEDLGYSYLPQEVVTETSYREYAAKLLPIDLGDEGSPADEIEDECKTGSCPIR